VVGWIKRGPSGVIGTNKKDAQETVETLLADAAAGSLPVRERGGSDALPQLLAERGAQFVEFDGWQAIDALEQQRGLDAGRPRIKLTAFEEMLEAARRESDGG
jgi:ferredoxin--NADP+ reductase